MKKKASQQNLSGFAKFCSAQENKARLSLILAAVIVVGTVGSVCAASIARKSDVLIPSENVELNAAQNFLAQAAIESGTDETADIIDVSDFIDETLETNPTTGNVKRGGLTGEHVVNTSDLKSLSDEDLVKAIVSGNAGVIAKKDIVIDQSQDTKPVHHGSEAKAPTPTNTPTPVPTNVPTPTMQPITVVNYELGIDVSVHNGDINWSKVKAAGVDFAFIRCGGRGWGEAGNCYEDTKFATNIKNAKAAGVKVGVYFFSQAKTAYEALEEASLTLAKLNGMSLDLPVVMDWETESYYRTWKLGAEDLKNCITAYCSTIAQNGYTPMVYLDGSNINRLGSYFGEVFSKYKLWYAYPYAVYSNGSWYKTGDTVPPRSYSYAYWQYSWHGKVSGISTEVDLDLKILGKTTLGVPKINLPSTEINTEAGKSIDPLGGVTATTSQDNTVTSGITYTITDSSGQTVSLETAQQTVGTYVITYAYTDSFRGKVTTTATWTVTEAAPPSPTPGGEGDATITPTAGGEGTDTPTPTTQGSGEDTPAPTESETTESASEETSGGNSGSDNSSDNNENNSGNNT
ncbi:MAG: hypothetical protein IKZ29_08670 [Clostridiales bacterium]|nr:hypothetical protein [Clostridiales bacterium]